MSDEKPAADLLTSSVPPGMMLVPKGGRPRKYARDAGVYLAYLWRRTLFKESAKDAEAWILEAWKHRGLSEAAHVRAAIARSKKRTWLMDCDIQYNDCMRFETKPAAVHLFDSAQARTYWLRAEDLPGDFQKERAAVSAAPASMRHGGYGCVWQQGMHEAQITKLVPLQSERGQSEPPRNDEQQRLTPIAAAITGIIPPAGKPAPES